LAACISLNFLFSRGKRPGQIDATAEQVDLERLNSAATLNEEVSMVATSYPHIVKQNGQPAHLEKHPRVRVATIVMDYLAYGWSPDEIRRQHPYLTLGEIHAAMGYYYDHQSEIAAEIAAEMEEVDLALKNAARSPVWLKLKAQGLIQ
jgi:uncharacterized protein (DUF433 family)